MDSVLQEELLPLIDQFQGVLDQKPIHKDLLIQVSVGLNV